MQTGSKSHCLGHVVTTHPTTDPGRIDLERKPQDRRGRGRRSQGLLVWDWDPRDAPSAQRVAKAGCGSAERGRGREGRGRFPRRASCGRVWPRLGPRPGLAGDSASPLSPPLPRSKPPFTVCLGLARLSASACRCVLRLSRHLDLASPSSISPSVSRRDGHLSRSLGLSLCLGCQSPSLFQLLLCLPQTACPARCLSRSGSLSELCLGLCLSQYAPHPRPMPASLSLRLSLSRLLSVSLLVLEPLKFLSETLPPSLSGAFPALAPSAQAWQIPFPCQVTMKTLATRKPPVFPVGMGVLPSQFPKTSLGESWDTPTAVVGRVQLRLQCAKRGGGAQK